MKILYEGGIYELMPLGGVARYFVDLINHLPADLDPVVTVPTHATLDLNHPRANLVPVKTKPPFKLVRSLWRRVQRSRIESQRLAVGADLHHWTYYHGLCRTPITRAGVPNVITVYDFIHEAFPELDRRGKAIQIKRRVIEAADHILCISQTTYEDLCNRFPHVANRASVTLLGNSFASVQAAPIPAELAARPFILFVGRRLGYKNFDVVLRAWKAAREKQPDLMLAIAGPKLNQRERVKLGIPSDTSGLFELPHVSDGELKGLYKACQAFVFPSRMEGFGLPAVEAMESGAPVLSSDCAALREVVGTAGYYFNPDDVDTLRDLFVAAGRGDLPRRDEVVRLGHLRANAFSWQVCAEQTLAAYRSLGKNIQRRAS